MLSENAEALNLGESLAPTAADESNPSEVSSPTPDKAQRWARLEPAIDTLIVAILAVASLAAAWSGYQGARWDGVQAASYTRASANRVESTRAYTFGHQLTIVDVTTFTSFADAYFRNESDLADFYIARFRTGFRPAFDAWIATDPLNNPDAPPTPFVMPEYVVQELVEADRLEAEAAALFEEGQDANQKSDNYVLNTVFLAAVLFFTAFTPRIKWFPARLALVIFSVGLVGLGVYNIATYPVE